MDVPIFCGVLKAHGRENAIDVHIEGEGIRIASCCLVTQKLEQRASTPHLQPEWVVAEVTAIIFFALARKRWLRVWGTNI